MYQSEYPQCALVLILRFNYSICLTSKIYAPLSIRSPRRKMPTAHNHNFFFTFDMHLIFYTSRITHFWPRFLEISGILDPTRKAICWFPSPNQPPSPARWSEELKPQNTPPFQSDGFLSYENLELTKETFEKGSTYCWWKKSCTSW